MSEIIYLSNVRLSFPHLTTPRPIQPEDPNSKKRYDADFILEQDHPGFVQFMKRVSDIASSEWKEHAAQVLQMIQSDRKLRCFGSGAEKIDKKTFKPYEGYQGKMYISANRYEDKGQPQVIQADGTAVEPSNSMAIQALLGKMYGGCRVNAAVRPWPQKNKHGNGLRCDLVAIQFCADDTPFGEGAADATPMFGAVAGAPAPAAVSAFGLPAFMTQ